MDADSGHRGGVVDVRVDDVLALRWPGVPVASPRGREFALTVGHDGRDDLWVVNDESASRVAADVSCFAWAPDGALTWSAGETIGGAVSIALGRAIGPARQIAWSSATTLGVLGRNGRFAFWTSGRGLTPTVWSGLGVVNPGPVSNFEFAAGGEYVAVATRGDAKRGLRVYSVATGDLAYEYRAPGYVTEFYWLDSDTLGVTVDVPPEARRYCSLDVAAGRLDELFVERGDAVVAGAGAHGSPVPASVSPSGDLVLYTLFRDGRPHLYLYDRDRGRLSTLTGGDWDDHSGARADRPVWHPSGRFVVYSSGRVSGAQRQLWRLGVGDGDRESAMLTAVGGTDWSPTWSADGGRLAFLHASPAESPELWICDPEREHSRRRVTECMPAPWRHTPLTEPEHITIPVGAGFVHADLFRPARAAEGGKCPAIVWVHGGVVEQMRYGWSPSPAYLYPYAWHQYLIQRGYCVLSLDYHGSTGYGLEYQMALWGRMGVVDVADCAAAAGWLGTLPFVDAERLAIWGISYGGYLALASMAMAPGSYRLGVSVAGVWDWELLNAERRGTDRLLAETGEFRILRGVDGPDRAEAVRRASPRYFAAQVSGSLLVLHGSGDERVPDSQVAQLRDDIDRTGLDAAIVSYPGQPHVFTSTEVWRDAFARITSALASTNSDSGAAGPPARIFP